MDLGLWCEMVLGIMHRGLDLYIHDCAPDNVMNRPTDYCVSEYYYLIVPK